MFVFWTTLGLLAAVLWILGIIATMKVARWRGRSTGLWGTLAFFFPSIALPILVLIHSVNPERDFDAPAY
ncbi:MAG: hypothetical protein LBQ06_02705 [Frankiaceae bacterium]|jgi:hypothetical protein|nr:hypothetical protein [Frankiaceae bacterium]